MSLDDDYKGYKKLWSFDDPDEEDEEYDIIFEIVEEEE